MGKLITLSTGTLLCCVAVLIWSQIEHVNQLIRQQEMRIDRECCSDVTFDLDATTLDQLEKLTSAYASSGISKSAERQNKQKCAVWSRKTAHTLHSVFGISELERKLAAKTAQEL